ncbi:MAG: hypothetical protein ACLFSQ_09195 [Candidatus Zixiibacteriota bacterium]
MKFKAFFIILLLPIIIFAGLNVTSKLTKQYFTESGEVINGEIKVRNTGAERKTMKAYLQDYTFSSDGSNNYGKPGSIERSNANWITINPDQAVIDPYTTVNIDYKITVPKDASLQGSYWSMIIVEELAEAAPELKENSIGLVINKRFGVQIITNFGTEIEPEIKFTNTELVDESGKKFIMLDIENTGEISVRSTLKVEVYDMDGNYIDLFKGEDKRTYPGTSVNLRCDLSKLKAGKYKAIVMADCGNNNIFGSNVNLEL